MSKSFSKGAIDRLGNTIRNEFNKVSDTSLEELQQYRTSYKESLSLIFNVLCDLTKEKKQNNNTIVTYRIKRFESIIGKLSRYPKMRFSRMWDIAGCRCILKNNNQVYLLKDKIEKHLNVVKVYDYINEPQEEGYKSLHIFATLPNDDKIIEIQLRNQTDHNWATLVEITDLLYESKLKEYKQDKRLLQFHYLLSISNELSLDDKKELTTILSDYEYFERLSTVFARNYLKVRKQWLEIENQTDHKFFLIETKKDQIPKIESFENFQEAEDRYYGLYKTSENANIVLTHLPNPCYNQISIAYSNYILTFHSFLNDCYGILASLITDSLKNEKFITFYKSYNMYLSLIVLHSENLISEIIEINSINANNKAGTTKIKRKKKTEWKRDIKTQIKNNETHARKLLSAVRRNPPSSYYSRSIFKLIMFLLDIKYRIKFRKVIAATKQ